MNDLLFAACWLVLGGAFTAAAFWIYPVLGLWISQITKRHLDEIRRQRSIEKSSAAEKLQRSPYDVWTGICYKCGGVVKPLELVRISFGGKPDKYFHKSCWDLTFTRQK